MLALTGVTRHETHVDSISGVCVSSNCQWEVCTFTADSKVAGVHNVKYTRQFFMWAYLSTAVQLMGLEGSSIYPICLILPFSVI